MLVPGAVVQIVMHAVGRRRLGAAAVWAHDRHGRRHAHAGIVAARLRRLLRLRLVLRRLLLRGLLRREDRADGRVLTRTETVRCILDAVGYGPIARLEGIFRTKFTDDASIPRADYGYVALAQGLGVVSGDTAGRFRPNASATRAQAAVMLCNLMSR